MNFKPMFDKVVIKPDEADDVSKGGILLPPSAREQQSKGMVVAVGPGTRNEEGTLIPLVVEVGDHVLYGKYAGSEIKIDGESYIILEEESIFGIIATVPSSEA